MADWSITHPKARKSHVCSLCGRIIDAGETYLRGVAFDFGTTWSWKECKHCEAVRVLYDISDDEGAYNEDYFYEWTREVRDVRELRHAAGYRMGWRTRRGTLLPVPLPTRVAGSRG